MLSWEMVRCLLLSMGLASFVIPYMKVKMANLLYSYYGTLDAIM